MAGKAGCALASMGVYVFTAEFLYAELERDHRDSTSSHDFGKDVIPHLVSRGLAVAHSFEESCVKTTPDAEAYWRDVGTIDSYWSANIDLVRPVPSLDIYDRNWPIWTYQQQFPPAKFVFDDDDRRGMAVDSMVSGGCVISGATVRGSLLFSNCRINSHARISGAVLLPDVEVGRRARLNRVVVDRRRPGTRRDAVLPQRAGRRTRQRRHAGCPGLTRHFSSPDFKLSRVRHLQRDGDARWERCAVRLAATSQSGECFCQDWRRNGIGSDCSDERGIRERVQSKAVIAAGKGGGAGRRDGRCGGAAGGRAHHR